MSYIDDFINFKYFSHTVLKLPVSITAKMINRDMRNIDDDLPFINGIYVIFKGFKFDPDKWKIDIKNAKNLQLYYSNLNDKDKKKIEKFIKLHDLNFKRKVVSKERLNMYLDEDKDKEKQFLAYLEKYGKCYLEGIKHNTALFLAVYDYNTGKKYTEHCWTRLHMDNDLSTMPPIKNWVTFNGKIINYIKNNQVNVSVGYTHSYHILKTPEVTVWKNKILENRRAK